MAEELTAKRPQDSTLSLSQVMRQADTNLMGTVHGGEVLKLVDTVAGGVAARHSGGSAVTAQLDETIFLHPVKVGDVVKATGRVTWVGRSSMEVEVHVTTERWDDAASSTPVVRAHLVMVAVDGEGNPRAIPGLLVEDDDDRRRHREAEIRRKHRLALREELTAQVTAPV